MLSEARICQKQVTTVLAPTSASKAEAHRLEGLLISFSEVLWFSDVFFGLTDDQLVS